MPKTYNPRQIEFMRLESEHAPAGGADEPDLTLHIRFFHAAEIAGIVARILTRVAKGKTVTLKPDTAYLVSRALRVLAAEPDRRSIVLEICGVPGGCDRQCVGCIGKANAIMGLYEGRKAR